MSLLKKIEGKTIIFLIMFTMLSGCASIQTFIPEKRVLRQIEYEKYILYYNDCKHKSLKYHRKLRERKEQKSRVVAGLANINNVTRGHAWVEVYNEQEDTWHMIDPTLKYNNDGLRIQKYPGRLVLKRFSPEVTTIKQYMEQRARK